MFFSNNKKLTEHKRLLSEFTHKSTLWSIKSCERFMYIALQKGWLVMELSLWGLSFLLPDKLVTPLRPTHLKWIVDQYQNCSSVSLMLVQLLKTINNTDINIRLSATLDTKKNRIIFSSKHPIGVWLNSDHWKSYKVISVKSFRVQILCCVHLFSDSLWLMVWSLNIQT